MSSVNFLGKYTELLVLTYSKLCFQAQDKVSTSLVDSRPQVSNLPISTGSRCYKIWKIMLKYIFTKLFVNTNPGKLYVLIGLHVKVKHSQCYKYISKLLHYFHVKVKKFKLLRNDICGGKINKLIANKYLRNNLCLQNCISKQKNQYSKYLYIVHVMHECF